MKDTIYRQDAIKAFCEQCGNLGEPCDGCNDIPLLYSLPSAQPTLYGYDIKMLALVAEIMRKNDIGPEEALCIFRDNQKIAEMIRGEFREMVRKQIEQIFPDSYVHIKDGDQHEGRQINKP